MILCLLSAFLGPPPTADVIYGSPLTVLKEAWGFIQSGESGCSKGFIKSFRRVPHADHCLGQYGNYRFGPTACWTFMKHPKPLEQPDAPDCYALYRLDGFRPGQVEIPTWLVVWFLGCVDFDLWCSTVCQIMNGHLNWSKPEPKPEPHVTLHVINKLPVNACQ